VKQSLRNLGWTSALAAALAACASQLPDAEFEPAAFACAGRVDYLACVQQARCAAAGKQYCGDQCVPHDASNCGGCGVVCPGGTCEAGHCTRCTVQLSDVLMHNTLLRPTEETARIVCPNMPTDQLVRLTIGGDANFIDMWAKYPCESDLAACASWVGLVRAGGTSELNGFAWVNGGGCADNLDPPPRMPWSAELFHLVPSPSGDVQFSIRLVQSKSLQCAPRVDFGRVTVDFRSEQVDEWRPGK